MASLEQINYQPHRAEISDGSLQWAPLKRKPIKNLPQIVWEDNSTWAEANLWVLDQATSSKRDLKTVRSNMSHLLAYAKWLEAESIQWWHFPERESERCLVRFRGALVAARNNGELAPSTASQRMAAVIRFYKWTQSRRLISPEWPMWEQRFVGIKLTNPFGLEQPHAAQIVSVLKKVSGNLNIKNRDDKAKVSLNKVVYLSPEFQAQWDRIKYKTAFRVDFDTNALIDKCAEEIKINLQVGKARFTYRKAKTEIDRGGVHTQQVQETTSVYESRAFDLPDLITYLQNETNLTRRTIVAIINKSGRLESFKNNPQKFIEQAANIIKSQMHLFIVDGIKYHKIGDDQFYAQELFQQNELFGYLKDNMIKAEKSVFDHVVYDSDIELEFASAFELNDDIKLYAKLPGWFKIDTPLGGYNPDWAVLIDQDGKEKLYFVVETKSTLFSVERRPEENAKIKCGYAHFEALGDDVKFTVSNSMDEFSSRYA